MLRILANMTENTDQQADQQQDTDKDTDPDKNVHYELLKSNSYNDREKQQQMLQEIFTDTNKQQQQGLQQIATPPECCNETDKYGTQRVYKKTSPNSILTLYLPTREIVLYGTDPAVIRGVVFIDPKAVEGYRAYAQLTLTFRYGREDEEVMGLRFCNEAIMSLNQIWPPNGKLEQDALSALQALLKRLGEGAHPFTLTLTTQAPPSVQLVPAKRYYGAPIGTSYDVRCFMADITDDTFHRRASVRMSVRVIYRSNIYFSQNTSFGPENYATLSNTSNTTSPVTPAPIKSDDISIKAIGEETATKTSDPDPNTTSTCASNSDGCKNTGIGSKTRIKERSESFAKLRLSPKSFRFSGRFGRSKSVMEKSNSDSFYNCSKPLQTDTNATDTSAGPQGVVDKPFLLQDGRVALKASLDRLCYAHGEVITVTIHIRNDSRKTVRKVLVCAIQHVDVCMFNNGKFKNVVADTDIHSPIDRVVAPGGTLNTTVTLKPQRGTTKNWIALEDSLQRSTEPAEISGDIAASAIRSNYSPSVGMCSLPVMTPMDTETGAPVSNERNVFAIYVSYYVKVKLTLSGMGGELSLKLPFLLVHQNASVEDSWANPNNKMEKLTLNEAPINRKLNKKSKTRKDSQQGPVHSSSVNNDLDCIESLEESNSPKHSNPCLNQLPLLNHTLTIGKDVEEGNVEAITNEPKAQSHLEQVVHKAQVHSTVIDSDSIEGNKDHKKIDLNEELEKGSAPEPIAIAHRHT